MDKTQTQIQIANQNPVATQQNADTNIFGGSEQSFVLAQRQIKALIASKIFPESLKTAGDIMIVLDMSKRLNVSPLMVAQNIYIVHGKPAWSSVFLIHCVNRCGRFSPLRYKMTGKKGTDTYGCIAWAKDLSDGEVLESPEVTICMAKAEGWYNKNGSKWVNMPELMLRYRAATLFVRLYAPELAMGMPMTDEVIETYNKGFEAMSRFHEETIEENIKQEEEDYDKEYNPDAEIVEDETPTDKNEDFKLGDAQ